MTPAQRCIVFAGIGKMGLPMAAHLAAAGHRVLAVDPSPARRALARERGLAVSDDLARALHDDLLDGPGAVIATSLPDDAAVLAVGAVIAAAAPPGATWIDTSTVSPAASAQAAARAEARGVALLRAPVSGNASMAERAQLSVYASGDRGAYDACVGLLACWGPQRAWLGPGEESRIAKLVVNLLIVGTSTMLAEALALGERGGLEWSQLWQVIEASAAASPIVRAKAPALRAHDYTPTFTVEQMRKDVALIREAAAQVGVATPVADVAARALDLAARSGEGGDDYAVVIRDARAASILPPTPTS
ncbi:MAG: NAD(P)-dependent oxidoreductase [Rubrivivax sp.]|nr:NAD(P)-dependent oxidoreductase [Rubrivivax sp.]